MPHLEGVIELGATATRLAVAEIFDDDTWHMVDTSELATHIGQDVFSGHLITRDSLMECLKNLGRFKEQLAGYHISPQDTTVVATSALREAANRDAVIDRILVKTGFAVHIIDGVEETRLLYLALMEHLKNAGSALLDAPSLIIEVGGGSTAVLLTEKHKIRSAHSFRLGAIIIDERVRSLGERADVIPLLNEYVDNSRPYLNDELRLNRVQQFFAIGQDARLAAMLAGELVSPANGQEARLRRISREAFDAFVALVGTYSPEERMAHFGISRVEARYLHIGLLAYQRFLHLTRAETLFVPATNLREGIVVSKRAALNSLMQEEFRVQIIASAKSLAQKYNGDEKHSAHVCFLARKLFDDLRGELGLDSRSALEARTLLEVAAILHDIGMFINGKNHEEHSAYIIGNSEIFGLSREDTRIVERIALYHRGKSIPQQDKNFTILSRSERMLILKLTSILRLADALDRGHKQDIKDFTLDFRGDTLVVKCRSEARLEKMSVAEKANLFEAVFGYRVVLE